MGEKPSVHFSKGADISHVFIITQLVVNLVKWR